MSDRGDAVEMVVTGSWTADATAAVQAGGVDRLVLNHALGFDETSLVFMEGLPLRELVILDPRLSDLGPIHSLGTTLRSLSVTTNPALKIDLGRLPGLVSLSASWPQVSHEIDAVPHLRAAYLRNYQADDLTSLASLTQLVELKMKDRPKLRSLVGISALRNLRMLGINLAHNLSDIEELMGRSQIEELSFEACRRIERIDALAECYGLRRLNLSECGDLASLIPIGRLRNLEQLSLFGSTKIADNDLTPIAALPRLQQLRMRSRRSYRPTLDEIQASLPRE